MNQATAPREDLFTPDCIRTFTGKYMNVFKPTPEMICIEDIAHALSNQCRFGGHLPIFYSVAQHSLNCSYLVENKLKLEALMHDASEAYLLDIPSPIKKGLTNYKEIEDRLMEAIAVRFGFQYPLTEQVKETDATMLQLEWDYLMIKKEYWHFDQVHREHAHAEATFLNMFNYYKTLQ